MRSGRKGGRLVDIKRIPGAVGIRREGGAFVIGAAFAGLAGSLFGHFTMYLHTNSFTFVKSFEIIIMVAYARYLGTRLNSARFLFILGAIP